jgi:peroxiredoxin
LKEATMFDVGDRIRPRTLATITGAEVAVPAPDAPVHLQFRRFAGCPICHLHLREVARRHEEITAAGITEVVLVHSRAEELRRYAPELPFAVVADPDRELYTEFGVTSSLRAVLHPGSWGAAVKGLLRAQSLAGALAPREDHLGKPADFLIDTDGTVLSRKYGVHADDQWSVDELLAQLGRR